MTTISTIYTDPYLTLEAVHHTEGPLSGRTRLVIDDGDSVGAFISRDDRILLVKQYRQGIGWTWELPAGKVDPGETSQQAVVREVYEETGALSDVVGLFTSYYPKPGFLTGKFYLYEVSLLSEISQARDGDTVRESRWFSHPKFLEMTPTGSKESIAQMILIHRMSV
jgi:8-oxo-dGTP pyrophosphatase MutT (NUDIX family)